MVLGKKRKRKGEKKRKRKRKRTLKTDYCFIPISMFLQKQPNNGVVIKDKNFIHKQTQLQLKTPI